MAQEDNRFAARAARYARVGANMGGVAARMAGARLLGGNDETANAAALGKALGGLKGPIMKMAQLFATIPEALPPGICRGAAEIAEPTPPRWARPSSSGACRRNSGRTGRDASGLLISSPQPQPRSARCTGPRPTTAVLSPASCNIPTWPRPSRRTSVSSTSCFSVHRRMSPAVDTREILKEVSERVREELHYRREAQHAALYRHMLAEVPEVSVPDVHDDLTTERLLTMGWLEGRKLLDFKDADLETRNRIAVAMFKAWWVPFMRYGVIHGDPHLGNYTVRSEGDRVTGINLLDYGCIRVFPASFVGAVVNLYQGLLQRDDAQVARAYDTWGFRGLKSELIDTLNLWAKFIYGPILDDRVRTVANGIEPGKYGRREAFEVHKVLKEKGPILIPREFVFMDRAAVGLGSVFLHLNAEMNFAKMFQDIIGDFDEAKVAERQSAALRAVGLTPSTKLEPGH